MLRIGDIYKTRKVFNIVATLTILDLSEDLQEVKFKCSFCDKIHEVSAVEFNRVAISKEP